MTSSRGFRSYLADGWHLGGAAIGFVLENRPLKRFLAGSISAVVLIAAVVAALGVLLRRHAGPVEYVIVGVAVTYCINLMTTAVAVGAAGITARGLDGSPVAASTGWETMRLRRRAIAGWAAVEAAVGLPSRAVGSWSIEQLGGLLLGFGWGILSFFAIPTIALTGAGPVRTARHSLRLVRRRWGDAVSSTVYLWVRALVVFGLPAAAAAAVGVLLIRGGHEFLGGALFVAGVAGLALAYLLAQLGRTVLTVVLYKYAQSGTTYPAFPAELLDRGVRGPGRFARSVARRFDGHRLRQLRRKVLGEPGD
jgi:Family of unknown function (DUF6159)